MRLEIRSPGGKCLVTACAALLACCLASGSTATTKKKSSKTTHSSSAHKSSSHSKGKRSKKTASWKRGQQKMDPQRAKEVQEALIREHYLSGEASGKWDDASQKAMEKYQADNGWQSKSVPDSRALIKLGLGPDHQHLLNPESAMTTAPVSTPAQAKDAPAGAPPQK